MVITGYDIAARRVGYCVGPPDRMPTAGVWRYPPMQDAMGDRFHDLRTRLLGQWREHGVTHAMIEAPLLRPHDRLLMLRNIYGNIALVEELGEPDEETAWPGAEVREADPKDLKAVLAGYRLASKKDMVAVCEKIGLALPSGAGREDAADSFAAWLVGVRTWAPRDMSRWDAAIWGRRGGMLL